MTIEEICGSLELILPNIRWDEEGSGAIREAVSILESLPMTPVYADAAGTVEFIRDWDSTGEREHYGKIIEIFNDSTGTVKGETRYCHILGVAVTEAQYISRGDLIGFILKEG